MLVAPLVLLSVLTADLSMPELQRRAQEEVDQLSCPCTEAGVTFSNAELAICKASLVTVKMFELMGPGAMEHHADA